MEKSIHYATQRFWRTMSADTMPSAQAALDRFCERIADRRPRSIAKLEAIIGAEQTATLLAERGRRRPTVADLAALEPVLPLPASCYPAMISATNKVDRSALVPFEGNAYSVPPGFVSAEVTVRHRLGSEGIEVLTPSGVLIASHRRVTPGSGYVVRDPAHHAALQAEVLGAFSTDPPCRRKANRPPTPAARAEAARLVGVGEPDVVVDLGAYAALVESMGRHDTEMGA